MATNSSPVPARGFQPVHDRARCGDDELWHDIEGDRGDAAVATDEVGGRQLLVDEDHTAVSQHGGLRHVRADLEFGVGGYVDDGVGHEVERRREVVIAHRDRSARRGRLDSGGRRACGPSILGATRCGNRNDWHPEDDDGCQDPTCARASTPSRAS